MNHNPYSCNWFAAATQEQPVGTGGHIIVGWMWGGADLRPVPVVA